MARRPPERYHPGELSHTRDNLGFISQEEARKMLNVLDGEIGVERSNETVDQKYRELQALNRRKADRFTPRSRHRNPDGRTSSSEIFNRLHEAAAQSKPNPKYLERIRMNFLAARPEHRVKTIRDAIISMFSTHSGDHVNRQFISRGDEIFFRHIENLTLSVRGSLALNRKYPQNRLKNSFFVRILTAIKNWDIEGLHQELTHLQINPQTVTFEYCSNLTRRIYEPIMRLSGIDDRYYMASAIKRLYDLNMLSLPKKHPGVDQIKNHYHTAIGELEYIFDVLKKRFYPLLLKLTSDRCLSFEYFIVDKRPEILDFLGLTQEDVISMPVESGAGGQDSAEPGEELETEAETGVLESPVIQKGMEILERMFPMAGWNRLQEFPDMLPYFNTLITFPKGFELVPPEDPLHQVFILTSILQELFYGFRSIEFGKIVDPNGTAIIVKEHFDDLAEGWRLFTDDIVAQNYLNPLYSFCREVERNPRFSGSTFGLNQETELLWLKKRFILPHLVLTRVKRTPNTDEELPRLQVLTTEFRELFMAVAKDIASPDGKESAAIKNPADQFAFEIENPVSQRFKEVLKLFHEETTNANLFPYTFSIVLVLDLFINDKKSFYYPYVPEWLYRRESEDSRTPQYTVPKLNPRSYFRQADRAAPAYDAPPQERETETRDSLTDLENIFGLRKSIDNEISVYRKDKSPFTVLSVFLRDFRQYCDQKGEDAGVTFLQAAAQIIKDEIREFLDIPGRWEESHFLVVLPGTTREESVNLAIRLIHRYTERKEEAIPVSIGIVEFVQTWGKDKLLKIVRQAAEQAASVQPPSLCLYDGKSNSFSTHSDVQK